MLLLFWLFVCLSNCLFVCLFCFDVFVVWSVVGWVFYCFVCACICFGVFSVGFERELVEGYNNVYYQRIFLR